MPINFTAPPFGKDLIQVIKDIFERFNFQKTILGCNWQSLEETYDRLCAKYGGHMCPERETKLEDNIMM